MNNYELMWQMMCHNWVLMATAIFALIAGIAWLFLIYKMAKDRNREPVLWVLLGGFTSPLVVTILLLIMGDAKK